MKDFDVADEDRPVSELICQLDTMVARKLIGEKIELLLERQ